MKTFSSKECILIQEAINTQLKQTAKEKQSIIDLVQFYELCLTNINNPVNQKKQKEYTKKLEIYKQKLVDKNIKLTELLYINEVINSKETV